MLAIEIKITPPSTMNYPMHVVNVSIVDTKVFFLRLSYYYFQYWCAGACGVNLINRGVSTRANGITVEFAGIQGVTEYKCKLNDAANFTPCHSPLQYDQSLSRGVHKLAIQPLGCGRTVVKIEVE